MAEPALVRLGRFVAGDPLTLDKETTNIVRDGVIDAFGCMIVGAKSDVATRARRAVRSMSAKGPARVIGSDMSAARPQAAFLNAVSGHAYDFDDWEIPGNTHPTVVLVPALLAVAESRTRGQELAEAYLAGFEVIARLGEALNFEHYDAGWHSTATLGGIGAAAACSRLMGLSAEETTHALSLALSSASGFTCQFGSNAKPVQAGYAARAGVEAVCLASAGLTGQGHLLDHPRGMAALMGGLQPKRLEETLDKLGKTYALSEHGLVLKPWPSCGYTHRIMTCAVALKDRVSPDHVAQIDLHMPDFHAAILPFMQPLDRPQALFSAPFVAAMGLLEGTLTLGDLAEEAWTCAEVQALLPKTHMRPFKPRRPDLNYAPEDPDRMVVTLSDGRVLEERCVYPLGAPQAPMSFDDLWAKFEVSAGHLLEDRAWSSRLKHWPSDDAVETLFLVKGYP